MWLSMLIATLVVATRGAQPPAKPPDGGMDWVEHRPRRDSNEHPFPARMCRNDLGLELVKTSFIPQVIRRGLNTSALHDTLSNIIKTGREFLSHGEEKSNILTPVPLPEGVFQDDKYSILSGLVIRKITSKGNKIQEQCVEQAFPSAGTNKNLALVGGGIHPSTLRDLQEMRQVIKNYELSHVLINVTTSARGAISKDQAIFTPSSISGYSSLIGEKFILMNKALSLSKPNDAADYTYLCVADAKGYGWHERTVSQVQQALRPAFTNMKRLVSFSQQVLSSFQGLGKNNIKGPLLPIKVPFSLNKIARMLKSASTGIFWSVLTNADVQTAKEIGKLAINAVRGLRSMRLNNNRPLPVKLGKDAKQILRDTNNITGNITETAFFIPEKKTEDNNADGHLYITSTDPKYKITQYNIHPFFNMNGEVIKEKKLLIIGNRGYTTNESLTFQRCLEDDIPGIPSCFGPKHPDSANEQCGSAILHAPALMETHCPFGAPAEDMKTTITPDYICQEKSQDLVISAPQTTNLDVRCRGAGSEKVSITGPGNLRLRDAQHCTITEGNRLLWGLASRNQLQPSRDIIWQNQRLEYPEINLNSVDIFETLRQNSTLAVILGLLVALTTLLGLVVCCVCTGFRRGRMYCCIGCTRLATHEARRPKQAPNMDYEMQPLRRGPRRGKPEASIEYAPSAPDDAPAVKTIAEELLSMRTTQFLSD